VWCGIGAAADEMRPAGQSVCQGGMVPTVHFSCAYGSGDSHFQFISCLNGFSVETISFGSTSCLAGTGVT